MEYLNFPDPQLFLIGFEIELNEVDLDAPTTEKEATVDKDARSLIRKDDLKQQQVIVTDFQFQGIIKSQRASVDDQIQIQSTYDASASTYRGRTTTPQPMHQNINLGLPYVSQPVTRIAHPMTANRVLGTNSQHSRQSRQTSSSESQQRHLFTSGHQPSAASGMHPQAVLPQIAKPPQRGITRGISGTTGGFPANDANVKRTTESTESRKNTDSESSQARYMRHTSSSIERARGRTFGKCPSNAPSQNMQQLAQGAHTWSQLRNYQHQSSSQERPDAPAYTRVISQSFNLPQSELIAINSSRSAADKNRTQQVQTLQKLAQNYLNQSTTSRDPEARKQVQPQTTGKKQSYALSSMDKQGNTSGAQGYDTIMITTTPFDLVAGSNHESTPQRAPAAHQDQVGPSPRAKKAFAGAKGTNQPGPEFVSSPSEMKGIIKRLNKPEMLLLNHLQNQIKYYYPQKMNKYLSIESSQETSRSTFKDVQQLNNSEYPTQEPQRHFEERKLQTKTKKAAPNVSRQTQATRSFSPFVQTRHQTQGGHLVPGRLTQQQFQTVTKAGAQANREANAQASMNASAKQGAGHVATKRRNYLTKTNVAGKEQTQTSRTLHKKHTSSPSVKRHPQKQSQVLSQAEQNSRIGKDRSLSSRHNSASRDAENAATSVQRTAANRAKDKSSRFIASGRQSQAQPQAHPKPQPQLQPQPQPSKLKKHAYLDNYSQKVIHPQPQKATSSTSISRRQQELSNARLYAGARAAVTLKQSLQSANTSMAAALQKDPESALNSGRDSKSRATQNTMTTYPFKDGHFQTRQPSRSHGTKANKQLHTDAGRRPNVDLNKTRNSMMNAGNLTERVRVSQATQGSFSDLPLQSTYSQISHESNPPVQQAKHPSKGGKAGQPLSAYIQVLERMKGKMVAGQDGSQTAVRASKSPHVVPSKRNTFAAASAQQQANLSTSVISYKKSQQVNTSGAMQRKRNSGNHNTNVNASVVAMATPQKRDDSAINVSSLQFALSQ